MLGLCCGTRAFSSCGQWGSSSLQDSHRCGLSCRAQALGLWASVPAEQGLIPCGMWGLTGGRMEPVSPAFPGRFLATWTASKALFRESLVMNYFDASAALARPGIVQGARPPSLGLKCHQGKHSLLAG